MGLIDEFKKQLKDDYLNNNQIDNEDLPWEHEIVDENLSNNYDKTITNESKPKKDKKSLFKIGIVLLAIIIVVFCLYKYLTQSNTITSNNYETTEEQTEQKQNVTVHVSGEVNKPGVYKLDFGSRIIDAIDAAGGFTSKANQNSLNLAKTIEDGEQIKVEANDADTSASNNQASSQQTQTSNGKININTADVALLQTLSGVGPSTAQKIIDYRNANGKFKSIDDLKKISGIGEKTFAKFADKICV